MDFTLCFYRLLHCRFTFTNSLEKLKKLQEEKISELDKKVEKEVTQELEAEKKTLDSEENI